YTHLPPDDRYILSLHDALPISNPRGYFRSSLIRRPRRTHEADMSQELRGVPRGGSIGHAGYGKSSRYRRIGRRAARARKWQRPRSEEHTSELQSRFDFVCRLLL